MRTTFAGVTTPHDNEELDEVEAAAMVTGDVERLGELWNDDLIVTNPGNVVVTRDQIFDMMRAGVIAASAVAREIEAVCVIGDTAITMGSESAVLEGRPEPRLSRYTHVWVRSGDTWKLAGRQASVVARRSCGPH